MTRILLLLFAGFKFSKLFISVGAMLLSLGLYAMIFGWRYAAGVVAMLFLHEIGHFLAARQRGLQAGLPTLIPFFGAITTLKDQPHDAETDAYVSLGGPLLGTVAALACYWLAHNFRIDWLLAVAYFGFFLNLLNLIPVPPFDGGRITSVLSPRIWLLGVPIFGAVLWYRPSPVLIIVAILAVPHVIAAIKYRKDSPQAQGYYAVTPRVRWEYGFYYVVLVAFLAMMMHDTDQQLRSLRNGGTPTQSEGDWV
jgi:Zn-dependent protease